MLMVKNLVVSKIYWAVLFTMAQVMHCQAQAFQKTDSGLKTSVQSVDIEIQFYSPSIVRVLKSPQGKTFKKESLSVIKSPEKTVLTSKQEGDVLALKSKILQVK